MADHSKKSSVMDKLLIIVIIVILVLNFILLFLIYRNERNLDLTESYSFTVSDRQSYSTAALFASDLVTSNAFVDSDSVILSSSSEKGLLFDISENKAIFAYGIYDKVFPASLSKLMTAVLALECGDPQDIVEMSEEDFDMPSDSQKSDLKEGDIVTMDQLLKLLLIYSANDASMAIARHIDGSVDKFVEHMNEKALELGMLDTHFTNPSGLHDDENYTSAYDVYIVLNEALNYTLFKDIISLSSYTLNLERDDAKVSYYYDSTDMYLTGEKSLPEDIILWGGKTGTTSEAGACLAIAFQNKNGSKFIAVIMNSKTKAGLYDDMNSLFDMAVSQA